MSLTSSPGMLGLVLCLALIASVSGEITKNIVASSCSAPHVAGGTATYTAPAGFKISGKNYFVVTGCSASGSIPSLNISSSTDCVTGRTPSKQLGQDLASITINGGGYCGEARISSDPNDLGVYGSSNPGVILVGTGLAPNPAASCCQAPFSTCKSVTYTAPLGWSIAPTNYLVVTGCSAAGYVVIAGKNISAKTDCVTGRTPAQAIGVAVDSVTVYGGGYCGEARLSLDPNDIGVYGSSNPGIKLIRKTLPNPVANCCNAPFGQCGSATLTAPTGLMISGENYFSVTGCSAAGTVTGTNITAKTDCVTGRTPAIQLGKNYASISITGGGYCGQSRITLDPNDIGVYGSTNPGVYLVNANVLLETGVEQLHKSASSFSEEGAKNVARLKARVLQNA